MTLTHAQAQALIHAAADGLVSFQQRGALDEHLVECFECRAYADELRRLEADLRGALRARLERTPGRKRAVYPPGEINHRLQRRSMQKRVMAFAQPALWAAGVLILSGAMTWLLGSVRPGTGDQPEGGEAISVAEGSITPSPVEALPSATPAPLSGCIATTLADQNVLEGPGPEYPVLGALPSGQVATVTGETNGGWLRIMLGDGEGWINAELAAVSGDCGGVEIVKESPSDPPVVESTAPPPLFTPTPLPIPVATETQVGAALDCQVAPTDYVLTDYQVYAVPGDPSTVIGTLGLGDFLPAHALMTGFDGNTWVQVDYEGQTAWVNAVYYQFTNGCTLGSGMPQLTPDGIFATLFPTPTYVKTPSATPTPLPSTPAVPPTYPPPDAGDIEFVMAVPGDAGTVETFTQSLPLAGDSQHIIQILIQGLGSAPDASQGAYRYISISVTCEGTDLQFFGWGLVGTVANWRCGTPFTQWVNNGFPSIYLALHTTPGSAAVVTYTITVTVSDS